MQRDIASDSRFYGIIDHGLYYDWETPYGYGGPLADDVISLEAQQVFKDEITTFCKKNNVVTQFVRFHPLLQNQFILSSVIEEKEMRDTIVVNTDNEELIIQNMDSKNRNMVRKAKKNGIKIVESKLDDIDEFIAMYTETMKKNNADTYYTFTKEYFKSLEQMRDNVLLLYAEYEGRRISGSLFLINDKYMHYHLAGTHSDYRKYSPNNLLLYKAACIAAKRGIKLFHLGGGMEPEDSLFGFKKQFNKNGRIPFFVGRTIFNPDIYRKLLKIRKERDTSFDINNNFMIQYRR